MHALHAYKDNENASFLTRLEKLCTKLCKHLVTFHITIFTNLHPIAICNVLVSKLINVTLDICLSVISSTKKMSKKHRLLPFAIVFMQGLKHVKVANAFANLRFKNCTKLTNALPIDWSLSCAPRSHLCESYAKSVKSSLW